jgi:plastocyanin
LALAAVLALAGAAEGIAAGADAGVKPLTAKVDISDYAFKPATITITAGTKISWTNHDDDPHTVTADDGAFDSHGLGQGDVYARVFATPGRYAYHCSAHPFMKGTVIVVKGTNGGSAR